MPGQTNNPQLGIKMICIKNKVLIYPVLTLVLVLLLCGDAQAKLAAYYQGNTFNRGSYFGFVEDSIFATIIFRHDSYSNITIGAEEILGWEIGMATDGPLVISSTRSTASLKLSRFSFSGTGKIVSWELDALPNQPCPIGSCLYEQELYTFGNSPLFGSSYTRDQAIFFESQVASASVANKMGSWSYSITPVPVPSARGLFITVILTLAVPTVLRRSRSHVVKAVRNRQKGTHSVPYTPYPYEA